MYFYSHIEYLLPIFITHQYSEYFVSVVFFVNTLFVIFAQTVFSRIFNELRAGIAWGAMALFHNSVILEHFNFAAVWLVNSVIAAALGGFSLYRYYLSRTLAYSR